MSQPQPSTPGADLIESPGELQRAVLSDRQSGRVAFFVVGVLLAELGLSLISTWSANDRFWVVTVGTVLVVGPVLLASVLMSMNCCLLFGKDPLGPKLPVTISADLVCLVAAAISIGTASEPWSPLPTFAATIALWGAVAMLTWSALRTRKSLSEVASGHALVLGGAATVLLGVSMWVDGWSVGGGVALLVGVAAVLLGVTYWVDDWTLVGIAALVVGGAAAWLGGTSLAGGFSIIGLVLVAAGAVLALVGIGFLPGGRKARVWLVRRGVLKNSWWAGASGSKPAKGTVEPVRGTSGELSGRRNG